MAQVKELILSILPFIVYANLFMYAATLFLRFNW